jgi:release factor glutamine methyltransferase
VSRLIRWAGEYLAEKGMDNPRLDGELLLAQALRQSRLDLYLDFDRPLTTSELEAFKALLKRRLDREPVAYITGRKGFYNLDLMVGPGALVPRPETELLVETALALLAPGSEERVLDLGTGCGAIALSLAAERPALKVTATDISPRALAWALTNAREAGLAERVELLQGDLFQPLAGRLFDLIAANPPYVAQAEYETLAPEIVGHEPAEALVSGPEGLDLIRRLTAEAPGYLAPGGWLLMEIGAGQAGKVMELLPEELWEAKEVLDDLAGLPRVIKARLTG